MPPYCICWLSFCCLVFVFFCSVSLTSFPPSVFTLWFARDMFGSESPNRRRSAGSSSSRDWNCSAGGEVIIVPVRHELGLMCFCFSPGTTARGHIYVKFGCFLTEENTIWTSQVTTVPYVRLSAGTHAKKQIEFIRFQYQSNTSFELLFRNKKWLTTNMTTKRQNALDVLEIVTPEWKSTSQPITVIFANT